MVNIHVLTNQGFWGFGVLGFWGSCLNYQATPLYVDPLPQNSKATTVEETFLAWFWNSWLSVTVERSMQLTLLIAAPTCALKSKVCYTPSSQIVSCHVWNASLPDLTENGSYASSIAHYPSYTYIWECARVKKLRRRFFGGHAIVGLLRLNCRSCLLHKQLKVLLTHYK